MRTVLLLPAAKQQISDAASWWSEHRSARQAERWLTAIYEAIAELRVKADDFRPAPEAKLAGRDLRQMPFTLRGRPTHRVVYELLEEQVLIYAVRHVAQDALTIDDFDLGG